ncbi:urea ABC transporter substrate-binding protein [Paenibacillus sp. IB182496]|uniref:Urea ABC transporter substrate-binding protein n=1 Tax=Paenibacillus sabuli TaxID=2772509 RepID=A0A927BXZ4_9BACL|nr:urea ABC transporter substrate-binding protein [Paenibacillus sabuli]MBD2847805.1 urea ABC transporter substrate-binding protein [Paenibacillus sabuli]
MTYDDKNRRAETIKVGILHSLTGTMAISEQVVKDAELMAISELNAAGGVLGRQVEAIVEDGASDGQTFAKKAGKLLETDRVAAVFGGWTSLSRKAMLPVFEESNGLLFYPLQYEGMEMSRNIFYTGATTNQQVVPSVEWLMRHVGRRFYLLGSDYVFPRTAHAVLRKQLEASGGEATGESYRPLGHIEFRDVLEQIRELRPDVIYSTLNGDSNAAFFHQYVDAGFSPDSLPVMSISMAEEEVRAIGPQLLQGHYTTWSYYQSLGLPANQAFVANFRRMYGEDRVTSDPMEAGYTAVHLWAAMVRKAGSFAPDAVRAAGGGVQFEAPEGLVTVDGRTQHVCKKARVGRIKADGMIEEMWQSDAAIVPDPFLEGYAWAQSLSGRDRANAPASARRGKRYAGLTTLAGALVCGAAGIALLLQETGPAGARPLTDWGAAALIGAAGACAAVAVRAYAAERHSPWRAALHRLERAAAGDLSAAEPAEQAEGRGDGQLLADAAERVVARMREVVSQMSGAADLLSGEAQTLSFESKLTLQASVDIAGANGRLSEQAAAQRLAATETAETIGEVAIGIQRGVQAAVAVSESVAEVGRLTEEGVRTMALVTEEMETMTRACAGLRQFLAETKRQSGDIGGTLDAINHVAKQTNILALNASIEAARLGRAGAGFVVIAHDIRQLAALSQQSAVRLGHLIDSMRSNTETAAVAIDDSTRGVADAVERMSGILGYVSGSVNSMAEEIQNSTVLYEQMSAGSDSVAASSAAQATRMSEMAAAVEQVKRQTDEQQIATRQIAVSANSLYRVAEQLQQSIHRFRV